MEAALKSLRGKLCVLGSCRALEALGFIGFRCCGFKVSFGVLGRECQHPTTPHLDRTRVSRGEAEAAQRRLVVLD